MTGTSVDYIWEGINKYLMTLAKEQIRLAFEQSEKEVIQKYAKDFGGNLPDTDVMILTGLARNTYYKYKRELKAALEEA